MMGGAQEVAQELVVVEVGWGHTETDGVHEAMVKALHDYC